MTSRRSTALPANSSLACAQAALPSCTRSLQNQELRVGRRRRVPRRRGGRTRAAGRPDRERARRMGSPGAPTRSTRKCARKPRAKASTSKLSACARGDRGTARRCLTPARGPSGFSSRTMRHRWLASVRRSRRRCPRRSAARSGGWPRRASRSAIRPHSKPRRASMPRRSRTRCADGWLRRVETARTHSRRPASHAAVSRRALVRRSAKQSAPGGSCAADRSTRAVLPFSA